ncbi:MAG: MerR family transcriptional regulator [Alphaproteobacteria bacterium]|nr:MerR family transcriptional regulator [Alphaproteobacteria bacterium]
MHSDDAPRYRINAVSEMTGVPSPTLRAWERRYGIPVPTRTDKGYRVYRPSDVEQVARLRDLCDQGMAAADAARLVKEQAAPLPEVRGIDLEADPYDVMADRLMQAIIAFDPEGVRHQVRACLTMGTASTVYERIFAPVQRRVGDAWHAGTLSVAQEHLASAAISDASRMLLQLVQPPSASRRAIIGCFADEQHDIALYGLAFRLAQWGYRVVVLGARTPPDAIADAVIHGAPDFIGLSLTLSPPPDQVAEHAAAYVRAADDVPMVIGGAGAVAHRALLEAAGLHVHAGDFETLRMRLTELRAGASA